MNKIPQTRIETQNIDKLVPPIELKRQILKTKTPQTPALQNKH